MHAEEKANAMAQIFYQVFFIAQAVPGVVRFLTHKDIPSGGENNAMPNLPLYFPEEVLCSGSVLSAGQALGIIVAGRALNHHDIHRPTPLIDSCLF